MPPTDPPPKTSARYVTDAELVDDARALVLRRIRLCYCTRTKAYLARRTAEGKTKREAVRCLRRCIAREVYRTTESLTTTIGVCRSDRTVA